LPDQFSYSWEKYRFGELASQIASPVAPAETKLMRRRRGDGGSKNSGEDNENSLSPTLAELAIGFAVPAIAQEQNTGAPEVHRQIEAGRGLTYWPMCAAASLAGMTLADWAFAYGRSALNIVKMDARSGLFMRFWNH
jgi:hypothetical protein